MSRDDVVSKVTDLCAQARAELGTNGSMTLQTLLDMVMIELRQLAERHTVSRDASHEAGRPSDE